MEPGNPFVYGEIVTAAAFADRDGERERLRARPRRRPEGVPDLAAALRQVVADPRRACAAWREQRVLTVEVTVAASSSYVGFLESYARALVAADTPASRLRRWTGELLQAVRPELRFDADPTGKARFALAFPAVRTARDTARLAAEVFALPAPHRRRPPAAHGDRARRVPGDRRLRRRQRRTRPARRRAGPTRRRLRLRRLRAVVDGTDARSAGARSTRPAR